MKKGKKADMRAIKDQKKLRPVDQPRRKKGEKIKIVARTNRVVRSVRESRRQNDSCERNKGRNKETISSIGTRRESGDRRTKKARKKREK